MSKEKEIKTILEVLWNIKDNDKFYFEAYGTEMIENILNSKNKPIDGNIIIPINNHHNSTIRTTMRNNVLFIHFLESYCLNRYGADYDLQEVGDFVAKYFNKEKVNDFLHKLPIEFGKWLIKRQPRTLEHSMEDVFNLFMDEYAEAEDFKQLDYTPNEPYKHNDCQSCNGNPCDC